MKKILAAALLLLVHFSNAQSFLNGFVVDAHNSKPLAFATVQLPELHLLVYSDSSGKFSIQNLPEGNFILKVSYIGYESFIQTVSVSQAKNILPIKLEPIELETEEVVIYGTHQNDWRNTPMDIVSLSRDDISGRGNLSLSSAIAKLPGMGEMTTGGISKPVIRGLYGNRIQTQVLGIRFDNMQFQDEHGLGLSDAGVERVEIIKGPASLSYGSDAMGGVINVIEENPARTGKTEMDVNLKSFSNTLGYAADAGWKKATQKWNLRLRLGTESHADYIDGNGSRIFNTRTGGYVAKASAGFRKPHWVMQNNYMFSHYNFGFVLNPAEFDSSLLDARGSRSFDIPHHTVLFNIFSSENTFFKGLSKVKLNFGFHSNNRMEREGGNKISLNMLLSTGNLTLQWNHPLEHKGEWTLGTDAMFQNNTNLGSRIIIPDADFFEDGIYFTVNLPVKKIVIEAGARFDYKMIQTFETGYLNTVDTVYINAPGQNIIPFSRTYTVANGAAGVSWNPSKDLNLKLNVASGFRAPNLAELSSKGLHEGTYRWEIGNPDLKSEQNLNTELQINFEADDLRLTAAAYVNSIAHYIYLQPTGNEYVGFQIYNYVQKNATLSGGEFTADLHPSNVKWLDLTASYSKVNGKTANGEFLPFIPTDKISGSVRIESDADKKFSNPFFETGIDYSFAQNDSAQFETATPSYYLLHASAGFELHFKNSEMKIQLIGNNLLDAAYYDHLSRFKYLGLDNPGRDIVLNLSIKF